MTPPDARRDGRRYHHGALAAAAIATAEQLVDAGGAAAVTVRAVAAAVGVSHTALYRHFADRDALLDAVGARFVQAIVASVPITASERSLLEQYCVAALEHPDRYRLAFDLAIDPAAAPLTAAAFAELRDRAGAVFAGDGRVTRDVVDRVLRTWGTVHGMLDLYWRRMIRAGSAQAATRYVLDGALGAVS